MRLARIGGGLVATLGAYLVIRHFGLRVDYYPGTAPARWQQDLDLYLGLALLACGGIAVWKGRRATTGSQ